MTTQGNITFQWIDPCRSQRLRAAQQALKECLPELDLAPDLFHAGPEMVKFADVLRQGRRNSTGDAFIWSNSDVLLLKNPYQIKDRSRVYGFHRTELPSGDICGGVDMYLIPNRIWDDFLSRDIPDLYCGASYVDWWITRQCQLAGCYSACNGYITHVTHESSGASANSKNRHYQHNLRNYNAWARRFGAATVDQPISLPVLGVWDNSVRAFLKRLMKARKK